MPESFRDQKQWAFEALRHIGRLVDEYASEFLELSRYAPTVVGTENMKVKIFLKGLDRKYANLAMLLDQPFDVLMDRAQEIEISYLGDDRSRVKKNRAKGSSSMPYMSNMGSGSQSHHSGKAKGIKRQVLNTEPEGLGQVMVLAMVRVQVIVVLGLV